MQDFNKMEKYYQSYINNSTSAKSGYLKFGSIFIIASGLILAVLLMVIINTDSDDIPNLNIALNTSSTTDTVTPVETSTTGVSTTDVQNDIEAQPVWQPVTIANGDTLTSLLSDLNVNNNDIMTLLANPEVKKSMTHLQVGSELQVMMDDSNHLLGLRYPLSAKNTLIVTEQDSRYIVSMNTLPTKVRDIYTRATINNSLYSAGHNAGLSTKSIMQLISIFSSKINFSRDIHPGDSIQVIYEDKYTQNRDLGPGDILAAKIEIANHTYVAVGYRAADGTITYYTPDGKSLKNSFLRAPVSYTHISSPFNMHRIHPILHINRPHEGVDLAAMQGAPVKAAADGRVIYMGRDGGYGNLVKIDHGNGVTTRYAHLSRFVKGLHVGSHVSEGERIAYVGSTGLATGPHLHFEVRINDVPKNPLTVALPSFGNGLIAKDKRKFLAQTAPLLKELNNGKSQAQA